MIYIDPRDYKLIKIGLENELLALKKKDSLFRRYLLDLKVKIQKNK